MAQKRGASRTLFETEAIVLKTMPSGESDLIVTLYTLSSGLVRAVAKGAKRSQKRFMNCLDLFGLVRTELEEKRGRGLLRIESCHLLGRPDLVHDPIRYGLGCLLLELTSIYCPEKDPDKDIFLALKAALTELAEQPDPLGVGLAFSLKLLAASGFGPNLESCLICHKTLADLKQVGFDPAKGGLVCLDCRPGLPHLSLGVVKTIRLCQRVSPDALGRIRFPKAEVPTLLGLTGRYLTRTADREIRSLLFLGQLGVKI